MIELNSFLNQIRMTNRVIDAPINTFFIMEALTGLEQNTARTFQFLSEGCDANLKY